jgi:hypothetical protein
MTTKKNQTENKTGMIRISAHPEAEKPEEQRHKTSQAHVKFLLELLWLLFDLWGLDTCLESNFTYSKFS